MKTRLFPLTNSLADCAAAGKRAEPRIGIDRPI